MSSSVAVWRDAPRHTLRYMCVFMCAYLKPAALGLWDSSSPHVLSACQLFKCVPSDIVHKAVTGPLWRAPCPRIAWTHSYLTDARESLSHHWNTSQSASHTDSKQRWLTHVLKCEVCFPSSATSSKWSIKQQRVFSWNHIFKCWESTVNVNKNQTEIQHTEQGRHSSWFRRSLWRCCVGANLKTQSTLKLN